MKKLYEIVKERFEKQNELSQKTETFKKEQAKLKSEIQKLLRLENVAQKFGGVVIAECAIVDIAEDCKK